MKKALVTITAAILAFVAGCTVTMHTAQPIGPGADSQGHPGYVISYRYGPLWFNEIYG